MYKSLWDIDIEQGFLLGWDSRTLLICQAIELEGLRIAAALHRWLWVRKPGEHWYPYRVYKNNWQTDVEVLSQFLGRVCALVFVVQRPFNVGFGHIWTYLDLISEKIWKIWKTQQESYNLGMFNHPFTFHLMGDFGQCRPPAPRHDLPRQAALAWEMPRYNCQRWQLPIFSDHYDTMIH